MKAIQRGAVVWSIAGALLLAWLVFSASANAGAESRVEDDIALAEKREHFYRVVAGDVDGFAPGPGNKLGRDLREIDAESLDSFTGDSNRYGGITDDLGFDPFNGVDCSECGPLDRDVIDDVTAIKEGNLDEVLDRIAEDVDPADSVPEPPTFLWIVWGLSLPVGIGTIYVRSRRSEESRYRDFAMERRLLGEINEAKETVSVRSVEWNELDALAQRLQAQIETRVNYRQDKLRKMRYETLIEEANEALDAVSAGNRALD